MSLEPALRLYCAKWKVDFGVLYLDIGTMTIQGRLTFGRGHAFWQVRAWTLATKPDREDRLYNNLTRALDRKLRELG